MYGTANLFLGIYVKKVKVQTQTDTCTPTFIAALFTISQKVEITQVPSTEGWINKIWYVLTVLCYLAFKKEQNSHTCYTWVTPEYIMLSEISQVQKDKYRMIPLI